jgi:hypothetical protein
MELSEEGFFETTENQTKFKLLRNFQSVEFLEGEIASLRTMICSSL